MIFLVFMEFQAFPERKDALFQNLNPTSIITAASGSLGLRIDGKCVPTFSNETLNNDRNRDWCSNIGSKDNENLKPWISYTIKNRKVKIKGFSIRSGCCYDAFVRCCCVDDNTNIDKFCCCELFSFSLQGSNNNITWKTIHRIEKDNNFFLCSTKTYEFEETESFEIIRLVQDEERPGCIFCMGINQIELYGETIESFSSFSNELDNEPDDSVSIIGKIKRGDAI